MLSKEKKREQAKIRMRAYRKRKKQQAETGLVNLQARREDNRCAYEGCSTKLSKYNKEPYCASHYRKLWQTGQISVREAINDK